MQNSPSSNSVEISQSTFNVGYKNSFSRFTSYPVSGPDQSRRTPVAKKRNIMRSCDNCRRRKVRCDGPKKIDHICSNCLHNKKPCTYVEPSKPRGPSKLYITGLEDKLEKMETLLNRLRPGQDFSAELGPPVFRDSWKDPEQSSEPGDPLPPSSFLKSAPYLDGIMSTRMSTHLQANLSAQPKSRPGLRHGPQSSQIESSDEDDMDDNSSSMHRLSLRKDRPLPHSSVPYDRFHGPSSSITLVDATRKLKQAHLSARTEGESPSSTSSALLGPEVANSLRRPEFWCAPKWELVYEGLQVDSPELLDSVLKEFPEAKLAEELIQYYFQHVNPLHSLLNKSLFYRQWNDRLYERDIWFSALVMSIFAVASRWSNDSRVLPREHSKQGSRELDFSKAGWHFFNIAIAIHRARRSLLYTASLFEVQTFSLLSLFLRGTAYYAVGWLLSSVGLRKAMDVGAQRKTVYKRIPSAEDELWKRAFWLLIIMDRTESAELGRPCTIGEEDFDLDFPLEIDDEYWENVDDPTMAFKQPGGLPSQVAAFNLWIRITGIIAFALRTLYAIEPKKIFFGRHVFPNSEAIVKQLDVALAEWVNSVPDHLQWPIQDGDPIFSNQSASLCLHYYFAQILIYRAFIPFSELMPPGIRGLRSHPSAKAPSISHSALAICVNAARACAQVVEEQMRRGFSNVTSLIAISNSCAAILIIYLWDLKAKELLERSSTEDVKPQYALAIQRTKEEIDIFIKALEWAEPRYSSVTQILTSLRESFPSPQHNFIERERYSSGAYSEPKFEVPPSSPWRWDSSGAPSMNPGLSSSQDRDLGIQASHYHYPPHRTNTYPIISAQPEHPHYRSLLRRDSDPILKQSTALWPAPHHSPSFLPRRPPSHNLVTERGSLPFISSMRRMSFSSSSTSSSRPAPSIYPSVSPARNDNRPYDHYRVSANGSDFLPTSDARSIPTPPVYDKIDYTSNTGWNSPRVGYSTEAKRSNQWA
ncbi:hypothetical protein GYMLUDRAFT_37484 [Collybiopsis luxurians FD-317 M1]|nr:hypothetical protein GYMLUDRAFT_37484 [Collybiopsis luxurians FD-317 M1]